MRHPSWEDWNAVNELFIRYVTSLDSGDVEGVVGCFAPDGVIQSSTVGQHSGHDASAPSRSYAKFKTDHGAQLRHMLSNLSVRIDADRGIATSYFLSYVTQNGETKFLGPGRYECDLVKRDGAWVFQKRFGMMDQKVKLEGL